MLSSYKTDKCFVFVLPILLLSLLFFDFWCQKSTDVVTRQGIYNIVIFKFYWADHLGKATSSYHTIINVEPGKYLNGSINFT